MLGVVMERARRSGFDPLNFFSAIRDVLFQSVECRLDEIVFALLVCLLVQIRPVAPVGIGARYNGMPLLAVWSSTRVVETKGSRGDVSIQKQVGSKGVGGRTEKQIAGRFGDLDPWFNCHVDLSAAVVEPYGLGILDKLRIEMILADKIEDRRTEV